MLRKTFALMPLALMLAFAGSAQASPLLLMRATNPEFNAALAQDPAPARKAETKTGPLSTTFDQAEMEAMVAELSQYIPQNPNLDYPIACSFQKTEDINAYATWEGNGKTGKPQATMVILTGILKFIDDLCAKNLVVGYDPDHPDQKITIHPGDERRLLRAVVAHEMGHLSKGHVIQDRMKGADMKLIYTREKEQEADMVGAAALQRAGYTRKDAEEMLLMLDADAVGAPILGNLLNDHADGVSRALSVAEDPRVLRALVEFDLGLAFGEVRKFDQATYAFDRAAVREPKLKEAYVNAAQSALNYYYDFLPDTVKNQWFRPDFGPLLASPLASRGVPITDADRANYANAERHVAIALQKAPDDSKAIEMAGLLGVLHPDGNPAKLSEGIINLQKAAAMATAPEDRIRIANNLAVGYQRAGDVSKGTELLVTTFAATKRYNAAGVENLGFAPLPKSMGDNAGIVANAMYMYLSSTPKSAPGYAKVESNYKAVLSQYGFQAKEIPTKGQSLNLCQVVSIVDGGQDVALFTSYNDVTKQLGKGTVELGIVASTDEEGGETTDRMREGQPVGVFSVKYRGGQVLALFQTRTEDLVPLARITSYSPGAYIELRPLEAGKGENFRVTNGMKATELYARVPEDQSIAVRLFRVGQLEEWQYFPNLNFGVQVKDGVIAGLTATPVKLK